MIEVQRLADYRGELTVRHGNVLLHREEVGLAYGALFGPDVAKVADWQEIAVKVVDARVSSGGTDRKS